VNIYKARHNNAIRIAEKVNALVDNGYLIFDDQGERLVGRFVFEDEERNVFFAYEDSSCKIIYFLNDLDFDNGIYDTVAEYNEQFADWSFVHPKHMKQLFPKRAK
jgi:hypothetical protein